MENINKVVESEVVEKVVDDTQVVKGLVVIAAVGALSYAIGKHSGMKSQSEKMNLFLRGMLAGSESAKKE